MRLFTIFLFFSVFLQKFPPQGPPLRVRDADGVRGGDRRGLQHPAKGPPVLRLANSKGHELLGQPQGNQVGFVVIK